MKDNKFTKLSEEFSWLKGLIDWHMPGGSPHSLSEIKSFISRKLQYIAFRPFEELDLEANDSVRRFGTSWVSVDYEIRFRIGGDKHSRLRTIEGDMGEESLNETIHRIIEWYERGCKAGFFDPVQKPLVWEQVVKVTRRGCDKVPVIEMIMELYNLPADLTPSRPRRFAEQFPQHLGRDNAVYVWQDRGWGHRGYYCGTVGVTPEGEFLYGISFPNTVHDIKVTRSEFIFGYN